MNGANAAPIGEAEGAKLDRLRTCIDALRVLARSSDSDRAVLVERYIDAYLTTETVSVASALERLRRSIRHEEVEVSEGEYWSIVKEYIRSLLHRMT
jgi:hypothetical protein